MNHLNTHHQYSPVTLSQMISEAVYKAVTRVDRMIRLFIK